jgi:hypothetical protein
VLHDVSTAAVVAHPQQYTAFQIVDHREIDLPLAAAYFITVQGQRLIDAKFFLDVPPLSEYDPDIVLGCNVAYF